MPLATRIRPLLRIFIPRNGGKKSPLPGGGRRVSGRGSARDFEVSVCFGYQPSNIGRDNNMNFPALQSLHSLACSLRRLWRQLPPGGSLVRVPPVVGKARSSYRREGKPLPYKYWLLSGVGARSPLPEGAFCETFCGRQSGTPRARLQKIHKNICDFLDNPARIYYNNYE